MKKAFSLFELIVVLFISSIIIISSFTFAKKLQESQNTSQEMAILKIDLNSTKIFLEKNINKLSTSLKYENETLYFDKHILLEDVRLFTKIKSNNIMTIKINIKNEISQTWNFNL